MEDTLLLCRHYQISWHASLHHFKDGIVPLSRIFVISFTLPVMARWTDCPKKIIQYPIRERELTSRILATYQSDWFRRPNTGSRLVCNKVKHCLRPIIGLRWGLWTLRCVKKKTFLGFWYHLAAFPMCFFMLNNVVCLVFPKKSFSIRPNHFKFWKCMGGKKSKCVNHNKWGPKIS